jgi:alkylation response protein AidB-like acyl-CoA dehydrogenase
MTTVDVGASNRVTAYTERFAAFLAGEITELEEDLARRGVGTPSHPRLDEAGRMHPEVWQARREVQRRAAALDLYAPHMSVAAGGGGFSRVEMHHVEEFVYHRCGLGLGLAALAWTEGPSPAIEYCSQTAREQYLFPLISGEITGAFCNTEPSVGSDVLAMSTHARRDGSDWVINGEKAWITNSHFADVLQVQAVTEPGAGTRSLSMFLIDANAPGVTRGPDIPTMLADGLTGSLEFRDVRVPAENVVGEVGDGFALAMAWINWRRLCRGGMCGGWGRWLLDRALDYSRRRTSGGQPIAEYQAVQHLLAAMDADIYLARATSLVAQAEVDALGAFSIPAHPDLPRLVSLIKVINDEAFFRVTDAAIQVRGAVGLIQDSPEEKLFRVARNLRIPAGTTEIQRNAIARGLLRRTDA